MANLTSKKNSYCFVKNAPPNSIDFAGLTGILNPGTGDFDYEHPWTWGDFLFHYFLGHGDVTLQDIGLYDVFWNHPDVLGSMAQFYDQLPNKLLLYMRGVSCNHHAYTWRYSDSIPICTQDVIYSLG